MSAWCGDSGGLGLDLSLLRRAATRGVGGGAPVLASARVLDAGRSVGRLLARLGIHAGTDLAELARGHASLEDPEARAAFVHTLRTIVDPLGQRVDASDRLYLAENIPFMLVWGENDSIIPVEHALAAHELVPSSRLELSRERATSPTSTSPSASSTCCSTSSTRPIRPT